MSRAADAYLARYKAELDARAPSAYEAAHTERLRQSLRDQHRCMACGRPLTDPESIDLGIGPDCAGKRLRLSLPDSR